jgi:hypothetical protein
MKRIIFPILLLALAAACSEPQADKKQPTDTKTDSTHTTTAGASQPAVAADPYWNELACLLAGLPKPEGSSLAALASSPGAQQHSRYFEQGWPGQEAKFVQPLTQWAAQELPEAHKSTHTVYYPFSGADFMAIQSVYPHAEKYVLFGLEPEGDAIDIRKMDAARLAANLANVQKSLYAILSWSFFRTNDMTVDFRRAELNGTLPVLLAFMARTGHEVLQVRRIQLSPNGEVQPIPAGSDPEMSVAGKGLVTGNQIFFRKTGQKAVQQLQYFSVDVSDANIQKEQGFLPYLTGLNPAHTYVKAASYLMYKSYFHLIKDKTLEISQVYVQDDSGMPIRMLDTTHWDLQYYGAYSRPIALFSNYFQQDLWDIYNQKKQAKPLEFGMGYQFRKGTSNMMIARKKAATTR